MEDRKSVIALVVVASVLVGATYFVNARSWFESSLVTNPMLPPVTVPSDVISVSGLAPVSPVLYDTVLTSPTPGQTFSISSQTGSERLRVAWEYPRHFMGKSLSFELALVPPSGDVIEVKDPGLPSYLLVTEPLAHEFTWKIASEVPPGNYWVRIYLYDAKGSRGYSVFSEPIVINE